VLVTGGAGFIGSHLVEALVAGAHEVEVWDDLSTGHREVVSPAATFHRRRLTPREAHWETTPGPFDVIFHLAGRAQLVNSVAEPESYYEHNVMACVAIMNYARRVGCGRLVYAASASCYGARPPSPVGEDAPLDPVHPYGISKWLGEETLLRLGALYQIPTTSLRLFNVYGPRVVTPGEAYGAVLPVFLAQRANGAPLTVIGAGTQRRDFVWVDDVVEAFMRAATASTVGVFNIGTGVSTSMLELVRLIGGPVVHIPSRGGEPIDIRADTSRARVALRWTPVTTVAEGVLRLLDGLDAWQAAPVWGPDDIAAATAAWHACLG